MSVFLQNVIDTYDSCYVLFDKNHEVVTANKVYCEVYAVTLDNIVGEKFENIFRHASTDVNCESVCNPVQSVIDSGFNCRSSLQLLNESNKEVVLELLAMPVYSASDELFVGVTIVNAHPRIFSKRDVTLFHGKSATFSACIAELNVAARSDDTVLLNGETGSGKNVSASFIHKHSSRSAHQFMVIDCPSITPGVFESEFFGYKKGAFADSEDDRNGIIDLADKGTILFDEIGEMPLHLQRRLIRFIETGEFRRLGGKEDIKCDVRVFCTTQKNLSVLVSQGLFMPDLYRLISGICITVPPLRERRSDIAMSVNSILNPHGRRFAITDDAMEKLLQYDYPGNFRELKNILFNASILAHQNIIDVDNLKLYDLSDNDEKSRVKIVNNKNMGLDHQCRNFNNNNSEKIKIPSTHRPLSDVFATHLETLLHLHNGHRGKVAKELKISERTLYRKLKYYKMLDVGRKVRLHYDKPVQLLNHCG